MRGTESPRATDKDRQLKIVHLNPKELHFNPAFSQVVTVQGARKLVMVGGQNGVHADGTMAGDDVGAQAEQAFRNVLAALAAAGARREDVIKLSIFVVAGQNLRTALARALPVWGPQPTATTVLTVPALANAAFLIEVEAMAAIG